MSEAALALGANVGESLGALRRAAEIISERIGNVTAKSGVYKTVPWGRTDQPDFMNACLIVETEITPPGLLEKAKTIERDIGRVKRAHWGPREIDIDIIFYDDLIMNDPELIIPHPLMELRGFVMVPLSDVAPGWKHPKYGWTVAGFLGGMNTEGITLMTQL
ncbi:MAG: 2-amino-4-hydroxy-6-hydroxymethyldihydropteridine diphosphokinase [Synergistaceae bacterium]|jgi:2-amino-4-hydroxy-6-hydroxymethyldihydropteridine diphosphokinase|nr:2-amino-4-hydroxy-6-hydroxymethyldihydropteridine diphosphokinase [Synergistaceae bacterium]